MDGAPFLYLGAPRVARRRKPGKPVREEKSSADRGKKGSVLFGEELRSFLRRGTNAAFVATVLAAPAWSAEPAVQNSVVVRDRVGRLSSVLLLGLPVLPRVCEDAAQPVVVIRDCSRFKLPR